MKKTSELQLPMDDLITRMNGLDSTNSWDVVTSYSVDELNTFIQDQYKSVETQRIILTQPVEALGKKLTVEYSFTFACPTLTFLTSSKNANIIMPFCEGSFYRVLDDDGKEISKMEISTKYSVNMLVPITAVSGTADAQDLGEKDMIITFGSGEKSSYNIVLQFKSNEAVFTITPEPDPSEVINLGTIFLISLENYLQSNVSTVNFRLAGINNYKPSSGQTLLTPKSFAFAVCAGDTSCLSLYIQTEQSGNGQGNSAPSFQPGDVACSPIPAGYSSSLIFSNRLLCETILRKQLEDAGFSVTFSAGVTAGIQANLVMEGTIFASGESGYFPGSSTSYGGLSINMGKTPFHFTIQDGIATLYWQGETTSSWNENIPGANIQPFGSVIITITINRNGTLTVNDNSILFPQFIFASSYSGSGSAADGVTIDLTAKACPAMQKAAGCRESVPGFYSRDMLITIPSIALTLPGFDFFLETNLLAPGQKMLNIDANAGVQTPHDFLIAGQIA